jgi:Protein of unknown function (DUF2809)
MKINKTYLLLTISLFCIETYIAIFVKDAFVRPVLGDFLSVILLYCLFKTVSNKSVHILSINSLFIAYFLEALQYFKFLKFSGLEKFKLLKILMGNSFSWGDIVAYTLGFVFILIVERFVNFKKNESVCQ